MFSRAIKITNSWNGYEKTKFIFYSNHSFAIAVYPVCARACVWCAPLLPYLCLTYIFLRNLI